MEDESMPGNTSQEAIKKELIDSRSISKKHDPVGRNATAEKVLEARVQIRSTREEIAEKESKLEFVGTNITQRTESILVKLKEKIGIKDKDLAVLQTESSGLQRELELLKAKLPTVPDAKVLLESYHEKVQTLPLTNQEKRELLTAETLASLSTEEYIALWRRLNPHFLSHVTRQGFRDHFGPDHQGGIEVFHDDFIAILKGGKALSSPIALSGLTDYNKETIKKFLIKNKILNETDAISANDKLHRRLHDTWATAPCYPDETAVHFASQIVADKEYGGEGGTEIFFLFPTDVIASQYSYAFNSNQKSFKQEGIERRWNDVFIWPFSVDNPGVPIDVGIVFLPKNMPVDPNTGSKYASEIRMIDGQARRVMIEDSALVAAFAKWTQELDAEHPTVQAYQKYKRIQKDYYATSIVDRLPYYPQEQEQRLIRNCLDRLFDEFQRIGFKDNAAYDLSVRVFDRLNPDSLDDWKTDSEKVQSILRKARAHWKRVENTVSAKGYWENYFAKNPTLRPKHIQYYDGDPTTAVLEFQQQNNIGRADTSKTDGELLGFDDHHVVDMEQDPRANAGYDELVTMANKIIAEHYKTPQNQALK